MVRRNFSNEFCPNLPIFLNESFAQRYALARSRPRSRDVPPISFDKQGIDLSFFP
jgi:hypothetical protein